MKISKVTLENFRTFLGKQEINFQNGDKPADFVCMYGKNGFGKTSLFHGVEWFFTGKIHLLEAGLKGSITNYSGNIIRNKYASESEDAGVIIGYSDGNQGCRKVLRKENDYNQGEPSGAYKNILSEKQILPHSKIDGFVYAAKPVELYKEWGNFWDPDGKQRETFKKICSIYEKAQRGQKLREEEFEALKKDIFGLDLHPKIDAYNKAVGQFNQLELAGIPPLKCLSYCYGEKISLDNMLEGDKLAVQLKQYIDKKRELLEQACFLEENFDCYQKHIQYRKELLGRKKRWEAIIKKCKEKEILFQQLEPYQAKLKAVLDEKDKMSAICNEAWFRQYNDYILFGSDKRHIKLQIDTKEMEKQKLYKDLNQAREKKSGLEQSIQSLEKNKSEWISQIAELDKQEDTCSLGKRNSLEKNIGRLERKKEGIEEELNCLRIEQGRFYQGNMDGMEKAVSDNSNGVEEYEWYQKVIGNLRKLNSDLIECKKDERGKKARYENKKECMEALSQLLLLANERIRKEHTNVCPVCQSSFRNMEQLIKRMGSSFNTYELAFLKMEWEESKKQLNEAEKIYENAKKELKFLEDKLRQDIARYNSQMYAFRKELNTMIGLSESIQKKRNAVRTQIQTVTGHNIETPKSYIIQLVCMTKEDKLNEDLEKCKKTIKNKEKKISMLDSEIQELELSIRQKSEKMESFYHNKENQEMLSILEQKKIVSYEGLAACIKAYGQEAEIIQEKMQLLSDSLQAYHIYDGKHIEKYQILAARLEIPEEEWARRFERYQKTIFEKQSISKRRICRCKDRTRIELSIADKKMEYLNACLSSISLKEYIKRYNILEDKEARILKSKIFSKYEAEAAESIFCFAKGYLEEYIANTLGGATIAHIYEKLEPHKRYRQLHYKISINKDRKPELNIKALNGEQDGIIPELFFSTAQLNAVALSIFLGGALTIQNPALHTIFIDDPIGHFDDLNVLSFIDVLRTIISQTGWQVVISTHEENFYEIMKIKLNPKYYNSKFLLFKDEGTVIEDLGSGI